MLEREEICLEKDRLESKMNSRSLVEEVGRMGCVEGRESDGLMIFKSFFFKLMNNILFKTDNFT